MEQLYDLVIVGAGPAGLSAAIYMARAKYKVLVLEQEKIGGQITITQEVVNYPGVYETSGAALTGTMHQQAEAFGAKFTFGKVTAIDSSEKIKKISTTAGEFQALSVILAVGANPRKLGFPGEEEFQGRGVAYCATCDGEFFKNMPVYVIGGGFAAVEEGMFLTKYASQVHMIVRKDQFSCAKTVAEKAMAHPNITVHFHTEVEKVEGKHSLESITLRNTETQELRCIQEEKGMGVFVFAGYVPNTSWLPPEIALEQGYIVTDAQGKTSVEGIYAAGDVRIKELRQVVTAVSDGAEAATSLEKYVEDLHQELNIPEFEVEIPQKTPAPVASQHHNEAVGDGSFLDAETLAQLQPILDRFQDEILVKAQIAKDDLALEMASFMGELQGLSPKIRCETVNVSQGDSYIELCFQDGRSSGVKYRAIPGGHEFNSFIIGLFYLSGAGTPLEEAQLEEIAALKPVDLQVCITLSCTMCPDVVQACQRIALLHPAVNTTVVDLMHAEDMKEKYNIMSVPCLVIGGEQVEFGKKTLDEVIRLLGNRN